MSQSLFLLDIYSFSRLEKELIQELGGIEWVSILIFTGYLFFQRKEELKTKKAPKEVKSQSLFLLDIYSFKKKLKKN
jgi:hypothetical protein